MLQRSILLFTDNFPLARLELLLMGGSVEKKISNRIILAELPTNIQVIDLMHSAPKIPDNIEDISIQALQQWKKTLTTSFTSLS